MVYKIIFLSDSCGEKKIQKSDHKPEIRTGSTFPLAPSLLGIPLKDAQGNFTYVGDLATRREAEGYEIFRIFLK